jgi:uncharacterized RDD family membrane protein YckC
MENSQPAVRTPSIKRRLSIMVYDSLLLAAVEILAVTLYTLVTLNLHSAVLDAGRSFVVILTAAAYFIHAWSGSGHTLAMKTWRVKLVMVGYPKVPLPVAVRRFAFAWGWIAPALIVIHAMHLMTSRAGTTTALWILLANIALWAATAWLDPSRQFLHDRLAGTRLIELPKKSRPAAPARPDGADQGAAG